MGGPGEDSESADLTVRLAVPEFKVPGLTVPGTRSDGILQCRDGHGMDQRRSFQRVIVVVERVQVSRNFRDVFIAPTKR